MIPFQVIFFATNIPSSLFNVYTLTSNILLTLHLANGRQGFVVYYCQLDSIVSNNTKQTQICT